MLEAAGWVHRLPPPLRSHLSLANESKEGLAGEDILKPNQSRFRGPLNWKRRQRCNTAWVAWKNQGHQEPQRPTERVLSGLDCGTGSWTKVLEEEDNSSSS